MKLSPAPRNLVFGGGVLIVFSVCGDGFVRWCELHGVNPIKALAHGVAVSRAIICCRKLSTKLKRFWGGGVSRVQRVNVPSSVQQCNLVEPA